MLIWLEKKCRNLSLIFSIRMKINHTWIDILTSPRAILFQIHQTNKSMQANVRIDITCQGIKTVLQEFWNIPKERNDADPCQHASGQLLSAALVFINPPFTAPLTLLLLRSVLIKCSIAASEQWPGCLVRHLLDTHDLDLDAISNTTIVLVLELEDAMSNSTT